MKAAQVAFYVIIIIIITQSSFSFLLPVAQEINVAVCSMFNITYLDKKLKITVS